MNDEAEIHEAVPNNCVGDKQNKGEEKVRPQPSIG
jgi:hypothetical protein